VGYLLGMSKKHFIALAAGFKAQAEAIRGASHNCLTPDRVELSLNVLRDSAQMVANVAAQHNPNFDYARFFEACGL
jgi:hypothetical protein